MKERDERAREQRIRDRAYHLWEQEGRPAGREDIHWDQATELVAIEDNQRLTMEPVRDPATTGPTGEPVEPLQAVENAGEFPTMTDQGEERAYPSRRPAQAEEPLSTEARGKAKPTASAKPKAAKGGQSAGREAQAAVASRAMANGAANGKTSASKKGKETSGRPTR